MDNFWFVEPDQKLRIHFEPGTRFSFSGEGLILLQFAIEHGRADKRLGVDVGYDREYGDYAGKP